MCLNYFHLFNRVCYSQLVLLTISLSRFPSFSWGRIFKHFKGRLIRLVTHSSRESVFPRDRNVSSPVNWTKYFDLLRSRSHGWPQTWKCREGNVYTPVGSSSRKGCIVIIWTPKHKNFIYYLKFILFLGFPYESRNVTTI